MRHSRRATRVAALGAVAAVTLSGLSLAGPVTASAAAPPAPATSSLSPNSAIDTHKDVELTWSAVSGATSYDVQILNDDDPDIAVIQSGTSTVNRWTVPVQLPTGEYRWRVRAKSGTTAGTWSSMATLERGWDGEVTGLKAVQERVPTLRWNPIPDASFYEVEINLRSFGSPDYSRTSSFVCWTSQTTFTPYGVTLSGASFDKAPGNMKGCSLASGSEGVADIKSSLIYGKTYFWRVRGRDGSVDTAKTAFTTPSAPCLAPWLESGITVAPGDSGGKTVTVPIGETAPTSTGNPECSDWSQQSQFTPVDTAITVGTVPAPSGLMASPLADGSSTRVTADPTFSWASVPKAMFYRLYVSRDKQIGDLDFAASTQATQITPVTGLGLNSTAQYWAVQACSVTSASDTDDADPTTGIDCGPRSAAKAITQVTTNLSAPSSFAALPGYLLATWRTPVAKRSPATAYDVQVVNAETGATSVQRTDRVASDVDGGTSSLVLPSGRLAEGMYRFRVRELAESGRVTAWSAAPVAAVVDRATPTLRLTSGSGFANRTPITLTFSEPVTNVSSSTLGVSGPSGHVAGSVTRLSSTSYRFMPSSAWLTGGYVQPWVSSTVVDRARKKVSVSTTRLRASTTADSAGQALRFVSGDSSWTTRTSSSAVGGSYRSTTDDRTTTKRAYARVSGYGTSVSVRACESPKSGTVKVYVDGRLRTVTSLYRSWTSCGTAITVSGLRSGVHHLTLVAANTHYRGVVSIDRVSIG